MHACIDELLALRDSDPDESGLPDHVRHCALCRVRLRELTSVRDQLRRLPLIEAPERAFGASSARLASECISSFGRTSAAEPRIHRRRTVAVAAAAMGAIVFVAILQLAGDEAGMPAVTALESNEGHSVTQSIRRSRELESILRALPQRPSVEQVSTAATLDTIETRVQWLDARLSNLDHESLSEAQAQRLWRERVELMDSFVKVRYAQTGRAEF